jgi:1-acyl-sn-glycerol-3-phosphate acyltransferase
MNESIKNLNIKEHSNTLGIFRLMSVITYILAFFFECTLVRFKSLDGSKRHQQIALLIQKYSCKVLRLLNIEVNSNLNSFHSNGLIVANHISYLDVLVIASVMPALFVTSVEVKNSGWVGWLCEIAGCHFVERQKKTTITNDLQSIDRTLLSGIALVVFPEATSSVGNSVLPFKSSLFESAVRTKTSIQSFCIHYGQDTANLAYYGDLQLIPHLHSICKMNHPVTANIQLVLLQQPAANYDRKSLAINSHQKISQQLHLQNFGKTDMGL